MPELEIPQIYIVTPPSFELDQLLEHMGALLENHDIACVRLSMNSRDEGDVSRAADGLRNLCHSYDVPVIIDAHVGLVEKLGMDGAQVPFSAKSIRDLRKEFGADPIIGTNCGTSRHDGMTAGEAGADYVIFSPVAPDPLGDGSFAPADLFAWWSEMIEVPVVAEGGLTPELVKSLADKVDFFSIGSEIWSSDNPSDALSKLLAGLS